MRAIPILAAGLATLVGSCAVFKGIFDNHPQRRIVAVNGPIAYAVEPDGMPGDAIGPADLREGDTVESLGEHSGGWLSLQSYALVRHKGGEIYVRSFEVPTLDQHLFTRLGPVFRLPVERDSAVWARAASYVRSRTKLEIESATNVLIQTARPADTLAIGYTITRLPLGSEVEYQISLHTLKRELDREFAIRMLAFHMATGRDYPG